MATQTPARLPRRRALAMLAALPALGGAACGYGSAAPNRAAPPRPDGPKLSADRVRIGYLPNLTHATALVGVQNGFIATELGGTELRATSFNAGPAMIEALNARSIDIGWVGPTPAINGYVRSGGASLRIISGSASGGVKLVVRPSIRTPDDLRGKRIATPQLGNTQDVALLTWITAQGWRIDARSGRGDVSVVRTDNKVTPNAYASGAIDGAWVPEPTASVLVAKGARVLLEESTLWPGGRFVTTNVIVARKFLAEHRDVVEAVLRGSVSTNKWINQNPAAAKGAANRALEELTGAPLPAEVLDPAWESIVVTDDPLAATLNVQAEHAVTAGLMKRSNLAGIYDLTPLNKVVTSAGRPALGDAGLGAR